MKKKQHNHEADIENPTSTAFEKNQRNRVEQLKSVKKVVKTSEEFDAKPITVKEILYPIAGKSTKRIGGGKSGKGRTTIVKKVILSPEKK